MTPLELVEHLHIRQDAAVVLLSASGGNKDILAAFEASARAESAQTVGIVARATSRLHALSSKYAGTDVVSLSARSRDGFLATNSLIAIAAPLVNTYRTLFMSAGLEPLPASMDDLWPGGIGALRREVSDAYAARLADKQTVMLLHSASLKAAAYDIESKFIEAALGEVLVSDFRNFGHGRHHWLDKNGARTAVIALCTEDDDRLSRSTLRLLPNEIPRIALTLPGRRDESLLLGILVSLFLTEAAGQARGIDPGRPGVPPFGSRLYSLPGTQRKAERLPWVQDRREAATARKLAAASAARPDPGAVQRVRQSHDQWVQRIESAVFGAVVADYDDTLCDRAHRFTALPSEVADGLVGLLEAGIHLGIATGRGKSVRTALRDSLPRHLWTRVLVGYYNGAEVAALTDDTAPHVDRACDPRLTLLAEMLDGRKFMGAALQVTLRPDQLTVECESEIGLVGVVPFVHALVASTTSLRGVGVVVSTRSLDVLTETARKTAVIEAISGHLPTGCDVLTIGDMGRWPGNDYELLRREHSLCCDDVSADLRSCWNVLPAGVRGSAGFLWYRGAMAVHNNTFTLEGLGQ
jgi:hypothetical protein